MVQKNIIPSTDYVKLHQTLVPASLEVRIHQKSAIVSFNPGGLHNWRYIEGDEIPTRGEITGCSPKSRRKARMTLEDNQDLFKVKFTLTYPEAFPTTGEEVKNHIEKMVKRIKREVGEVHYFWVLEFQDRGAPHLHFLIDKFIKKEWLSRSWYEVVDSGDPKHLSAGTWISSIKDPEHDIGYLTTYLGKEYQKKVPQGFGSPGRFWGGNVKALPMTIIKIRGDKDSVEPLYREMETIYRSMLEEWGKRSGKAYTFKENDFPGFTAWNSTASILKALDGKNLEVMKDEDEVQGLREVSRFKDDDARRFIPKILLHCSNALPSIQGMGNASRFRQCSGKVKLPRMSGLPNTCM